MICFNIINLKKFKSLNNGTLGININSDDLELEEFLIDYFIEIGHLIPNIASANAVFQILKCLSINLMDAQLFKICNILILI